MISTIWLICGFVAFISFSVWLYYKGDDFKGVDLMLLILMTLSGPVGIFIILMVVTDDKVLIKGRKNKLEKDQ